MPSVPPTISVPTIASIKSSHRGNVDARSPEGQRADREVDNFIAAIRASALRTLAEEILAEIPQADNRAALSKMTYTIGWLSASADELDPTGKKMDILAKLA